jgi:hypothetical protein
MPGLTITTTHKNGTVTTEPFIRKLGARLDALVAGAEITLPDHGQADLEDLDRVLAQSDLTIDQRMTLKCALRGAGRLA